MVRINIIDPAWSADQHPIAEYKEILMLLGHVRKHPTIKALPERYCLRKGHICFFKDKLLYLKERHELLKREMLRRGFQANKTISLQGLPKELCNSWQCSDDGKKIIKKRITENIHKNPTRYTYRRKKLGADALIEKIKKA